MVHQAVLYQAPQSLKEDLHSSYSLLLGPSLSSRRPITLAPTPQAEGQPLSTISLKPEPNGLLPQRGDIPLQMCREIRQWMKISLQPHRRNRLTLRKGKQLTGSPP